MKAYKILLLSIPFLFLTTSITLMNRKRIFRVSNFERDSEQVKFAESNVNEFEENLQDEAAPTNAPSSKMKKVSESPDDALQCNEKLQALPEMANQVMAELLQNVVPKLPEELQAKVNDLPAGLQNAVQEAVNAISI